MSVPRPPCPHCPLLRSPRAARAAFPGPREAFTSLAVCPRCRTPPPAASLRAFPCGALCRGAPSHVVRHAEARAVERAGRDAWSCPSRRLLAAPPSLIPPSHVAMALLNPPLLLLPAPPRPSSPLPAPLSHPTPHEAGGGEEAAEKYEKVKMKGNVVKRRQWLNLSLRSYRSAFSWVDVALAMPERELIAHAGLDNVVFLHALKLGFKIFGPILIVAAAVLVPVNYLGGGLQQQAQSDPDLTYSDIDMLSIANIPNQSSLLWVHVAMAWLFNAWALYMMRLEHRTVADMRLDYLADQQRAPNQFTVLVRQVPKHPIKTVPEHVDHFFSVNHRGHYLLTQPVYNANRVARLEKKRGKLENKITELHIKLERFPNKPLTVRMGFMGLVGEKVDAIQHYQDKLEEICDEIIAERERVISDPASTMPAAFVSFSSRWGAAVAAQTLQSKNSSHWITQWAPEQRDVKWSNLPIPYEQLAVRRVLVLLAAAAIVFFYTIPVGFVQSLANLDKISRYLPWLQPILSMSVPSLP
ncbi:unnamed protein product, partial [Closterium sp. NIES-53]